MAAGIKLRLTFGPQKKQPIKAEPLLPPEIKTQPELKLEPRARVAVVEPELKEELPWRQVQNYSNSVSTLTAAQKQELDEIISEMQQLPPDTKFYIYGHTCDLGGEQVNERLGLRRAEKVKAYLLLQGVSEECILEIASKGTSEPLVPNTSEANRKQNRWVEIFKR
jgi:outer membrane protein OmpA-like peptidoglycan-associated protein